MPRFASTSYHDCQNYDPFDPVRHGVLQFSVRRVATDDSQGRSPRFGLYEVDTSDSSKFGTDPNVTTSGLSCTAQSFQGHLGNRVVAVGDIVAVNGQPAKGTYAARE